MNFQRNHSSESNSTDCTRGQVGIGTLIVFIALVLVAAIAAGVLINTAGFLQAQSEETGQESTAQVTDRLQAVAITGDNISNGEIHRVNVTVSKAPGAQDISVENVTVQWVGSSGTFNLLNESAVENPANEDTFSSTPFKDADDSFPVLSDSDDRIILTFEPGTSQGFGDEGLGEGESVEIRVTTESGSTSIIRLSAPDSLSGVSAVAL